ncbi:MAG: class B sortase, partial [Eubacteriales bacterium]
QARLEAEQESAVAAMTQEEMEEAIASHVQEQDEEAQPHEPIDFEGLQELNEDVYAWISIPGTEIEYPIVQHETDDTYYLNYNIDGSYGYPGCIYTEKLNAKDFSDPNTLIYGHNMKNGTMFAGLHSYFDKDFFDENQIIYIYMPDQTITYQIFAAYIYDDRHLLYSFDFTDEEVYGTYLEEIFSRRDMQTNLNTEVEVTTESKIITLCTCIGDQPDNRLLVQAVRVEK